MSLASLFESLGKFFYCFTYKAWLTACQRVFGKPCDYFHLSFLHAARRNRRSADTHTGRFKSGNVAGYGIAVCNYSDLLKFLFRGHAVQPEALGVQKHEMIVRTASYQHSAIFNQLRRESLGILNNLRGIFLKRWLKRLQKS